MTHGILEGAGGFFEMGLPDIHHAHRLFHSILGRDCARVECCVSV